MTNVHTAAAARNTQVIGSTWGTLSASRRRGTMGPQQKTANGPGRPGPFVWIDAITRRASPPTDQMPMRWASSSRWYVGSPKSSSLDFARLKYRCAGCSQVKPMPPWIWMFSAVAWKYASEQ